MYPEVMNAVGRLQAKGMLPGGMLRAALRGHNGRIVPLLYGRDRQDGWRGWGGREKHTGFRRRRRRPKREAAHLRQGCLSTNLSGSEGRETALLIKTELGNVFECCV